jgi:Methyltransferase domain
VTPMQRRRRPAELEHEDVSRLLLEHLDSRGSWQLSINALRSSLLPLVESAETELDDESIAALWSTLVFFLSHTGLCSPERKQRLFAEAEEMGLHVFPVYYSSPLPDTRELRDELWERELDVRALGIDEAAGLEFLARCSGYVEELDEVGTAYAWDNPQFNRLDARLYYAVLRMLAPRRVYEVGSGHSTVLASLAAERNPTRTRITCIDPAPRREIDALPCVEEHFPLPVQKLGLEMFDRLQARDVVFVDSSHVSRIGSDVNRIVLEVLPRLAAGVVVHFHDVFLPWEYPRRWVVDHHHFWNEQYLLAALLLGGRNWQVLFAAHYMAMRHPREVCSALRAEDLAGAAGSSFWMRRR